MTKLPDAPIAPRVALTPPELLAPAGDWECARAAVENGADAVYFGLNRFNARMRAHNFTDADLPELMKFLHARGVRGYVTFNTLVFANELSDAQQYLRSIIAAGVDAAIVQDIGIARLIRKLSPDFPIHASTQMTITSAAGVAFAHELGCNLVVLARECSLKDIEAISGKSRIPLAEVASNSQLLARSHNLPLEVFVHGALCVAYSGQCLTSESLGGRSANRGECAQACRMPYELISDGVNVPLGDKRYLLSPQDLAGLEVLPELIRTGVASLKIEGRLKTPEYVANVTRVYRDALDRLAGKGNSDAKEEQAYPHPDNAEKYDLEMAFSRGLYTGWFRGINNQELVHARFGKKRGVFLGNVLRVSIDRVILNLEAPLKAGDGIVFDRGHPDEKEEGGRVFTMQELGHHDPAQSVAVTFAPGAVDFSRIGKGDKVWKTSDPALDRRLRQTFAKKTPQFQRPITVEVHGHIGVPLTVIARDESGSVVQATSSICLAEAETQPLTTTRLRDQLGRLGGSAFKLGDLRNELQGKMMLPVSELNRLRRKLVAQLETLRAQPRRWTLTDYTMATPALSGDARKVVEPELVVLVRTMAQLEATLGCGIRTIYCEFEDPKRYREAVVTVRCAAGCDSPERTLWVAPPRITKPNEEWILDQIRSSGADGYLIRNYDHLTVFSDARRRGDFSLNVANSLTAEYFVERYGLERVTASYDLNFEQISALLESTPPRWFEVTIHQHMPMFHMEHCVFCAFLSKGTDFRSCGRPCDKHEVKLRDRVGAEHPLKADAGCRNTLFNGRAQTGAEYVPRLLDLGVESFRLEFLNETPNELTQTVTLYRRLLCGEVSGGELWRQLKLRSQLGVTRGQMERPEKWG